MNIERNNIKKTKSLSFFLIILLIIIICGFLFDIYKVKAIINIDSNYRWAWNDIIGWIDFYFDDTEVTRERVKGYVNSSIGYIALDCQTTPVGDICSNSDFAVLNDGSGNLSGWAWNDAIGWISFDSATAGSSYIYQVIINSLTGDFSGWAWNDTVGWISFNCSDINICSTSNYKVKTTWVAEPITASLISSVFDTQRIGGTAINTIMWQGEQPTDTSVKFQIASSNSSDGPWLYLGPDGSDTTYYTSTGPNDSVQINLQYHNNHRYFRYKVFLVSDNGQNKTPRIDDIIINYSP
ncbi:hypothetical protein JW698_00735 [Candidatus Wolfebacteria bacterium]|nr:hypothetical protein [Candidatus Wolfebacteria bacterium]